MPWLLTRELKYVSWHYWVSSGAVNLGRRRGTDWGVAEQHYPNYLPKLLIRIGEISCLIEQLAERGPPPDFILCMCLLWCNGLMVSVLVSGSSGSGSSPGHGHCVVFSWVRHFTLTVPLSTQVDTYHGYHANLMLGVTLPWTSIPPREGGGLGERGEKYSWSLFITGTGDKRRPDGPLGLYTDFTLPL